MTLKDLARVFCALIRGCKIFDQIGSAFLLAFVISNWTCHLHMSSLSTSQLEEIDALKARVKVLENELRAKVVRETTNKMEEIVIDSNPYRYVLSL